MFLKWSTSLSTLLKKQHSLIGALFVFISQVSLSHLYQWFMSYLIFYGGSLELLFWQLFLFSFHFFFLLCFWVFNNLFLKTKTSHLFAFLCFSTLCSRTNPVCSHNSIMCCCAHTSVPPPPSPNPPIAPTGRFSLAWHHAHVSQYRALSCDCI